MNQSDHSYIFTSIVIAVHNQWDKLFDCLKSLSIQKRPPKFEVIIVDDGSATKIPLSGYIIIKILNIK